MNPVTAAGAGRRSLRSARHEQPSGRFMVARKARAFAALLAVTVAACADKPPASGVPGGDVMLISPQVLDFFKHDYSGLMRPGAMAVGDDGTSVGYSLCPDIRCTMYPTATDLALQACVKSGGHGCKIFAVGDEITANYKVMGQ